MKLKEHNTLAALLYQGHSVRTEQKKSQKVHNFCYCSKSWMMDCIHPTWLWQSKGGKNGGKRDLTYVGPW